jgi:hypothetical protein
VSKHNKAPYISKGRPQVNIKGVDLDITTLVTTVDAILSSASIRLLAAVDLETTQSMRWNHQDIAKTNLSSVENLQPNRRRSNRKWLDNELDSTRTTLFRMGGFGSVMAVFLLTTQGHFYSTITVLGAGGVLKLPELGLELEAKPGDVIWFIPNQQLHKLDIDQSTPQSTQPVLTLWTDSKTMVVAKPSAHRHPDFQPASLLSEDARERCHVAETADTGTN